MLLYALLISYYVFVEQSQLIYLLLVDAADEILDCARTVIEADVGYSVYTLHSCLGK
jgi:hypothetical protein